jgi:hypothetical protein
MDEQLVVFDETFLAERRRAIMPLGLKIYVWIGIVFGAFVSIGSLLMFLSLMSAKVPQGNSLAVMAVSLPFGIGIFMMTFLLWSEVKWAIKFNWVIGALWVLLVLLGSVFTPTESIRYIISAILFLPYWIWLYRIQKKWESTAVRGKQL